MAQGPEGSGQCLYVEVPDVAAALDGQGRSAVPAIFRPETVMGNLVLGQFLDPEGHVIGLIEGAAAG